MKILTIIILIVFTTTSCYHDEDFDNAKINLDDVIVSIKATKDTLLANQADTTTIIVELPLNANDSGSNVLLFTNSGIFLNSQKNEIATKGAVINENGTYQRLAKVVLQSSLTPGTAKINVNVANYVKAISLIVKKNEATKLKISSPATSLKSDPFAELNYTVDLLSPNGKVTPGEKVDFSVKDLSGNDRGTLYTKNDKSNESGQTNFIFRIMPDTAFKGTLKIKAQSENGIASDSILLYILK